MTPKQKAEQIVNSHKAILMSKDTECGNEILCTLIAIRMAKETVSNMIDHTCRYNANNTQSMLFLEKLVNELNSM